MSTDRHAPMDSQSSDGLPMTHELRSSDDASAGSSERPTVRPISERYTVRHVLAKGGLGQVLLAYDRVLQREVAIKEIKADLLGREDIEDQFRLEALVTGRLEHPSIVPVHDLGSHPDGRLFYCMKLLQGRTYRVELRMLAEERRGADRDARLRQLLASFIAVCRAMAFAHSRGVLHLDLKPENIILGDYGETQIVDWGLAKLRISDLDRAAGRRLKGVIGTPRYMSPEQLRGDEDGLTPAADIYALGVILAETMLVADGRALPAIDQKHLSRSPEQMWAAIRRLSGPLRSITAKALAEAPGDRFEDARDLARELERCLAGERVLVHRESLLPKAKRLIRRHKAPAAGLLTALLVLAGWGVDRAWRRADDVNYAAAAVREAEVDWRHGRPERGLERLELALGRLQRHFLVREVIAATAARRDAINAWIQFDAALEKARFLSVDPDRAAESAAACSAAEHWASIQPDAAFLAGVMQEHRQQALEEIQLLHSWLRGGPKPVAVADGRSAHGLYLAGRQFHLAGKPREAADSYRRCLAMQPDHFWAMFFLSDCSAKLGDAAASVLGYTACLARESTLPFLYINRGNAYMALAEAELAMADYKQAEWFGAADPRLDYNRGLLLANQRRWRDAEKAFSKAVAADSKFWAARLELARVHRQLKNYPAAIEQLQRVIDQEPQSAVAFAERAFVYWDQRKLKEAIADADRSRKLDPRLSAPEWVAGLVRSAEGDWAGAVVAYSKALDLDAKNIKIRNNRAAAYLELGRFAEAKTDLDVVLAENEDYPLARFNRAIALIGMRRPTAEILLDIDGAKQPRGETAARRWIECQARVAVAALRKLDQVAATAVVDRCLTRMTELMKSREPKFRETVLQSDPLIILMRQPSARQRLQTDVPAAN